MPPIAETAAGAQLVTSPVYGVMKKEIRARDDGGWRRVEWDLPQAPTLRDIEVVHGRLIYLNPKVGPTPCPIKACGSRGVCPSCAFRHLPGA